MISKSILSSWTLLLVLTSKLVTSSETIQRRDISTQEQGDFTNEGEAHDPLNQTLPQGSKLTDFPVGGRGDQILSYITDVKNNSQIKQAIVMIHGKNRDGGNYYWIAQNALSNAAAANFPGADKDSTILAAPEFFSEKYNSGQYSDSELAWGDVNAWQAGDTATHPSGTTSTAFDALDAIMKAFANKTVYPNLSNLTFVGHGGGGQLMQRYAVVGQESPRPDLNVRYVVGDPSTTVYWTADRPAGTGVDPSQCPNANVWRYGFDRFAGTAQGLKTPQEYFAQYIKRQVIFMIGYQDTELDGDEGCEARSQGGQFRRDRNLLYWKILNTLASPLYGNDAEVFPGTLPTLPNWVNISQNQLAHNLIVVEDADHDPNQVFGSKEGQAALFSSSNFPLGWRPDGFMSGRNNVTAYVAPQKDQSSNNDDKSSADKLSLQILSSLSMGSILTTLGLSLLF